MLVANRYARALADVVAPTGKYREVQQELLSFAAVSRTSAELREVLTLPSVRMTDKAQVLDAVLARLGVSAVTHNFLQVLLAKYRLGLIEEICQAFLKVVNERLGIVQVKVFTPIPLEGVERDLLQSRFRQLTSKETELEFHLDADLLGGLVAQIGSTVYDGSVRGQLERLRQQLLAP